MLINNVSFKELPLMEQMEQYFLPISFKSSFKEVKGLSGRWIGQGPLVDKFEKKFKSMFAKNHCIPTGSDTDALLAYI